MHSMAEYGIPRTLARRRAVLTLPEEVLETRTAIKQLPLNQLKGFLSWGLMTDGRHHPHRPI